MSASLLSEVGDHYFYSPQGMLGHEGEKKEVSTINQLLMRKHIMALLFKMFWTQGLSQLLIRITKKTHKSMFFTFIAMTNGLSDFRVCKDDLLP